MILLTLLELEIINESMVLLFVNVCGVYVYTVCSLILESGQNENNQKKSIIQKQQKPNVNKDRICSNSQNGS